MVITTASMQALNMWWLAKGRVSYPLMFSIYAGYLVIETTLALRDSYQWSIGLFCLLNIWAMGMGVRGLLRERQEKKDREHMVEAPCEFSDEAEG